MMDGVDFVDGMDTEKARLRVYVHSVHNVHSVHCAERIRGSGWKLEHDA
jgi:hypothetical protein